MNSGFSNTNKSELDRLFASFMEEGTTFCWGHYNENCKTRIDGPEGRNADHNICLKNILYNIEVVDRGNSSSDSSGGWCEYVSDSSGGESPLSKVRESESMQTGI